MWPTLICYLNSSITFLPTRYLVSARLHLGAGSMPALLILLRTEQQNRGKRQTTAIKRDYELYRTFQET